MSDSKDFVFPSVEKDAKRIREAVNEAVRLRIESEVIKDDIKAIAEDLKDKFEMPPALFNKYVAAAYDKNKFMDTLEIVNEIADNLRLTDEQE